MNIFEKAFTNIEEAAKKEINKFKRERQLKAQHKTFIAQKEEKLIELEAALEDRVTLGGWSFEELVETYENIEILKEEIEFANKTFYYVFKESDKKTV